MYLDEGECATRYKLLYINICINEIRERRRDVGEKKESGGGKEGWSIIKAKEEREERKKKIKEKEKEKREREIKGREKRKNDKERKIGKKWVEGK